jgi:hypothetical protein
VREGANRRRWSVRGGLRASLAEEVVSERGAMGWLTTSNDSGRGVGVVRCAWHGCKRVSTRHESATQQQHADAWRQRAV